MNVPKEPARRRVWIIGELRLRGTSLTAIARELGITRSAVSMGLLCPSQRVEQAIARALAIPVHLLFPDRYASDGTRIVVTRPANRNTARAAADSQKQRRA